MHICVYLYNARNLKFDYRKQFKELQSEILHIKMKILLRSVNLSMLRTILSYINTM